MRYLWLALLCGAACGGNGAKGAAGSGGGEGAGGGGSPAGGVLGVVESGRATYYAADGTGACSFDASPNDLDVAALDMPEWRGSALCGACAAVSGPHGSVTVRIVDLCPGCEQGHLDLSQSAFAKIADVSAGNVPITWQFVACDVSGPVSYLFKDGSSQYWTAIQVRNHRRPVFALDVQAGGAWQSVMLADYDYFVDAAGTGAGPFMVRITADDGEQLVDSLPAAASNLAAGGMAQFQ